MCPENGKKTEIRRVQSLPGGGGAGNIRRVKKKSVNEGNRLSRGRGGDGLRWRTRRGAGCEGRRVGVLGSGCREGVPPGAAAAGALRPAFSRCSRACAPVGAVRGAWQAGAGAVRALLHLLPVAVPSEASRVRAAVDARCGGAAEPCRQPSARRPLARRSPTAASVLGSELPAELGNVRNRPSHTAISASSCFGSVRGTVGAREEINTALV